VNDKYNILNIGQKILIPKNIASVHIKNKIDIFIKKIYTT